MNSNYLHLDKILDIKKWQNLQDSLALVTGLAIITVDYKGFPITRHSGLRPFCKYMRENPPIEKYCQRCDSRGGLEAVRINEPYIYLCHCDIVDMAIPIRVDDKYVGAIMAGEVSLPDEAKGTKLEKILISPVANMAEDPELRRLYSEIPVMPYQKIEMTAHMLANLCYYIVEEAMNKNLLLDMYEKLFPQPNLHSNSNTDAHSHSVNSIENVKNELSNAVTNAYIKTSTESRLICKSPTLKPAFDYIYNNKREYISQAKAAQLCHISPSHFSRLFAKETGVNFSEFLSRIKVEWSKQLLEKTDLPITQISDELGFSEPGYFVKVFKKYENLTPAVHRKYYNERVLNNYTE